MDRSIFINLTAEIAASYLANNNISTGDVPAVVQRIHGALASLGEDEEAAEEKMPVVSIRASVRPDYLVCMECGKKQKMIRRHLRTAHAMSPEQYRKDFGLPASYPMTAPNYSERRRDLAKEIGLGRKKETAPSKRTPRKR